MSHQYGDEDFIYEMARKKLPEQDDDIQNDINDGYVVIRGSNIPFDEREIIENRLFMTVPTEFALLPQELAKTKYPNENRPDIIFSNEIGSINITFSLTGDPLKDDDVKGTGEHLQQIIIKMNPSCGIISSEVIEENVRIGYFDFISPAIDGEIYNLMFIFSLEGEFILGTFNCMHQDMNNWQEIAIQMLGSIRAANAKE